MANMQMSIGRFGPEFACAHLLPCNKGRLIVCEFHLSDDSLDVINLLIGARAAGKLDPLHAQNPPASPPPLTLSRLRNAKIK